MVCRRVTFDFDQSFKKMLKPTLCSQVVIHQQWNLNRFIVYGGFHVVGLFCKQYQNCLLLMDPTKILYCYIYIYDIWNPCTSWGVRIYQLYYRRVRSIRPLYTTARMRGMQRDVVLPAPWLRGDALDYGLSGSMGIKWLTNPLSLPAFLANPIPKGIVCIPAQES